MTRPSADPRRLDDGLLVVMGLAWGAGLIHVQAALDHLSESPLYAALFIALATAQFLWGAALYRAPGRRLLAAGAIASLAVVTVWALSRVTGLPIGPTPGTPERIGLIDSVATADEVLLAILVALRLLRARMRIAAALATGAALCLILMSSLSLVSGIHAG